MAGAEKERQGKAILEIGTEELPASFFYDAIAQLRDLAARKLSAGRLPFERIESTGTPRRLVLEIAGLQTRQEDHQREIRGPSRASAYDPDGKPLPPLLGFLKTHGAELNQARIKEFSGKPYVIVALEERGQAAEEVLARVFPEIIRQLTFPKSMRWNGSLSFGRPIRWILALLETRVVEFALENLKSSGFSYGHRFLAPDPIPIPHPDNYAESLKKAFVVPHHEARRDLIKHQAEALARKQSAQIFRIESLLDEVTLLVEYPTAFLGSFEPRFLSLPQEVLVTVMQHHQRYFPLVDAGGKLLNHFVAVRNGTEEGLHEVRVGNEQVIRARFKDAEYFYRSDQKTRLLDRLPALDKLQFQKNLGSLGQKLGRLRKLVRFLAGPRGLGPPMNLEDLDLAVSLSKCDLTTQMVYEFPELQGVMGRQYARLEGYPEEVAQAILDHYLPRFQGDDFPQTRAGTLLAIADRIDTLVGCFSAGIRPSSSSDPLALRRAAGALLQILVEKELECNLSELMHEAFKEYRAQLDHFKSTEEEGVLKALGEFLVERAESVWKSAGVRYDLFRTFLEPLLVIPRASLQRALFLEKLREKNKEEFVAFVLAWIRVFNILKAKEAQPCLNEFRKNLQQDPLLSEETEKALWNLFASQKEEVEEAFRHGKIEEGYRLLSGLVPLINTFFDKVLVMAPEEEKKRNRLLLLWKLQDLMLSGFGDLTQVVLD